MAGDDATAAEAAGRGGPAGLTLAALGVVALGLRFPGLGRSLWYDEVVTAGTFTGSALDAVSRQVAANNHPLASLLAWAARGVVGDAELALRLPSLLLGAATAPALAWAAGRALGARAGLVAGAFAALAPAWISAAQQVRGYAALGLASTLALGLAWGGVARPLGWRGAVGLAAATALAAWSHLGFFPLGLALLAALALAPQLGAGSGGARARAPDEPAPPAAPGTPAPGARRPSRALAAVACGLLLGAALWAPIVGRTLRYAASALASPPPEGRLGGRHVVLALGGGGGAASVALAFALLAFAAAGVVALVRDRRPRARAALLLLLAPLAAAAVPWLAGAPAYARFLWVALPGLLPLAAAGVVAAGRRRHGIAALVALVTLAGAAVAVGARADELQDLRGAVRVAGERVAGGRLVALGFAAEAVRGYGPQVEVDLDGAVLEAALARGERVVAIEPFPGFTPPALRALLRARGGAPLVLPGRESPVHVWTCR